MAIEKNNLQTDLVGERVRITTAFPNTSMVDKEGVVRAVFVGKDDKLKLTLQMGDDCVQKMFNTYASFVEVL